MKKMLLVALAGLSLTLGSGPRASAYCRFNFGVGCNLCFECCRNSSLPVDCGGPIDGSFAGPGPVVDGALPGVPHIAGPEPVPVGPKPMPNVMPRADTQPVGFFGPTQQQPQQTPDFAVPSYWYGR